jgi:hypothetical protein
VPEDFWPRRRVPEATKPEDRGAQIEIAIDVQHIGVMLPGAGADQRGLRLSRVVDGPLHDAPDSSTATSTRSLARPHHDRAGSRSGERASPPLGDRIDVRLC